MRRKICGSKDETRNFEIPNLFIFTNTKNSRKKRGTSFRPIM